MARPPRKLKRALELAELLGRTEHDRDLCLRYLPKLAEAELDHLEHVVSDRRQQAPKQGDAR
jgi:hypothetical protein